jgi:type 1 glutamine amidotransferase
MKTIARLVLLFVFVAGAANLNAAEPKPLQALLITGGGYHDYVTQRKILTEGISARANVEWTVVLENPKKGAFPKVFAEKNWAEGFDVIVHNQCFAQYSEDAGIERVVKDHLDRGVAAVMIHCAMHAFRDGKTKEWDKLVGVESRRHGAKFPIIVKNMGKKHPITMHLPESWKTPQGELYHTKPLPSTTRLGIGFKEGAQDTTTQTCIWANTYKTCRVFGTTLGHHNETMREKVYLDLVTNGLLWSCKKLDKTGKPAAGYGKTASRAVSPRFQVVADDGRLLRFANERALKAAKLTFVSGSCCGAGE